MGKSISVRIVEAAKADPRVRTYVGVGEIIGKTKQQIDHVKGGRVLLSLYEAAQLCPFAGIRFEDVASELMADHAKTDEERRFWLGKSIGLHDLVAGVSKTAAALVLGLSLWLAPTHDSDSAFSA